MTAKCMAVPLPILDTTVTCVAFAYPADSAPTTASHIAVPAAVTDSAPLTASYATIAAADSAPTQMLQRPALGTVVPRSDQRLLRILLAKPRANETPAQAFARKECELGNAFLDLAADQTAPLHARLTLRFPDDELAIRFAQLSSDRRRRLLAFLRHHCGNHKPGR